ncbi:MAG: hypothetical protein NZ534_12005, partial [Bacteroidia bacterium]|nr:hypothetical protein [Bacteroidia bacterium]
DALYVYDGADANAPLLGMFTASNPPPVLIEASQQNVFFQFVADNVDNLGGWTAYVELRGFCSNSVLTDRNGFFDDGSGDFNYANNSNCTWLIAPAGHPGPIRMNLSGAVEEGWDFVVVYDGPDDQSPVLAVLTGAFDETITTTASQALVAFYSDEIIGDAGFNVFYGALYCDGLSIYESLSGTVSDGSGSFDYANFSECFHIIAPPGAEVLSLSGTYNLEAGWDFAFIFTWDGSNWAFSEVLTGSGTLNRTYTAAPGSDAAVLIYFFSDYSITFDGFDFTYNTVRVCPRGYNLALETSEDDSPNRCEDNPYFVQVYSLLDGPVNFDYLWTRDGEFYSDDAAITITESGTYELRVSGDGCLSEPVELAEPIVLTFFPRVAPELLSPSTLCIQDGPSALSVFPETLTLSGEGVDNGMF